MGRFDRISTLVQVSQIKERKALKQRRSERHTTLGFIFVGIQDLLCVLNSELFYFNSFHRHEKSDAAALYSVNRCHLVICTLCSNHSAWSFSFHANSLIHRHQHALLVDLADCYLAKPSLWCNSAQPRHITLHYGSLNPACAPSQHPIHWISH